MDMAGRQRDTTPERTRPGLYAHGLMELVLSTSSLKGLGGSESYLVTIGDHLQRLGHEVWLHAYDHGAASDEAEQLGLRICRDERDLPEQPDALVVQDGAVACELAVRYPTAPLVFVAHSDLFDLQLPPQLPELVAVVVTLYDRVERRIRALALPYEIVRLTQPIDVDRFKPIRPLRREPKVALAVSNYLHGERIALLASVCNELGIEFRQLGQLAPGGQQPPLVSFNEADLVFGKARVIYEAMACGRAAYVFDHNGGDGWVTAANFQVLSADNFGGQSEAAPIDRDRLMADLAAYDPLMGTVNRDLVVANNSATKHVARLAEILERVAPRREPVSAPLKELARLVRLNHRAEARAFLLHAEMERLGARVHDLEEELGEAREAASAARAQAAASAADAERAWSRVNELTTTRRWRLAQALCAPVDRLREWLHRRPQGRSASNR
jgi:hypothetical protein